MSFKDKSHHQTHQCSSTGQGSNWLWYKMPARARLLEWNLWSPCHPRSTMLEFRSMVVSHPTPHSRSSMDNSTWTIPGGASPSKKRTEEDDTKGLHKHTQKRIKKHNILKPPGQQSDLVDPFALFSTILLLYKPTCEYWGEGHSGENLNPWHHILSSISWQESAIFLPFLMHLLHIQMNEAEWRAVL